MAAVCPVWSLAVLMLAQPGCIELEIHLRRCLPILKGGLVCFAQDQSLSSTVGRVLWMSAGSHWQNDTCISDCSDVCQQIGRIWIKSGPKNGSTN